MDKQSDRVILGRRRVRAIMHDVGGTDGRLAFHALADVARPQAYGVGPGSAGQHADQQPRVTGPSCVWPHGLSGARQAVQDAESRLDGNDVIDTNWPAERHGSSDLRRS